MLVESPETKYRLLRRYWPLIPGVFAILFVVEVSNDYINFDRPAFSFATIGLLVSALSIFLAFRINESYNRWWEARRLWGTLVSESRSFARKVKTLVGRSADSAESVEVESFRRELIYRQLAYLNALRMTMRGPADWEELSDFLAADEMQLLLKASDKPVWLLEKQAERLADAHQRGWVLDMGMNQFDRTITALHLAQGGCERIKNTPVPEHVSFLTRWIAWLMALVIPVAITDPSNRLELVDMVIVPVMMLSFLLVERLGAELRKPFSGGVNDTPMNSLCAIAERNLREILGEESLPPAPQPEDGVLM